MTGHIAPHAVRAVLAEALALVFPVECAGCGREGVELCSGCRAALVPDPVVRTLPSGLVVHAGLVYRDEPGAVLRAVKEHGRTGLARALAPALRDALHRARPAGSRPVVVPVPSSHRAMRRRGFAAPELIARRAGARPAGLLRPARTTLDQRELGRDDRRRNVAGSLAARHAAGLEVIVVDDVVTTGATLEEARRALSAAGASVIAAATVAATPLRFDAGQSRA